MPSGSSSPNDPDDTNAPTVPPVVSAPCPRHHPTSHVMKFFVALLLAAACNAEGNEFDVWQSDKFALYPKLPIAFTWSEDPDCRRDSQLLLEGLKNQTYWAMQMYDSSAHLPNGILHGNTHDLGAFDECMVVQQPIRSHMCPMYLYADVSQIPTGDSDSYEIEPPYSESVWKKFKDSRVDHSRMPRDRMIMTLCVPRSCSHREVNASLNKYLSQYYGLAGQGNRTAYSVSLPEECVNNDPEPIRNDEIAFWVFCATLVSLAFLATVVDLNSDNQKESRAKRILMAYSLRRNLVTFTKREGESGPLDFLYGIKFISIVLIIYDHRCCIFLGGSVFNYQKIEEELRGYNNLFLPHGDLLVDTFFFIGGLLSCYLLLELLAKRYISPLLVIFGRYIRIAPLYMFIVWFYASGLMRLGSGPVWRVGIGNESVYCLENWWTNALFINNYVHADESCTIQAWYLACDLHFFIICVALVFTILKHKKMGLGILITLTVVSSVIPAVVATLYKLQPTVIFYHEFLAKPRRDPTYLYLYVKSHTRATVYFIGVLTGYFLYRTRASTKRYGTAISMVSNFVGLCLLFAPMLYGSQFYDPGRRYSPLEAGIFASSRRVIWALGCVLLMLTYRFGKVPLVGPLCSSHAMIVLSKLTYGMYLIHFIYQVAEQAKVRLPNYLNLFDLFTMGTSDVVASAYYALVVYLLIELPTRSLFKELIFSRDQESRKQEQNLYNRNIQGVENPAITQSKD